MLALVLMSLSWQKDLVARVTRKLNSLASTLTLLGQPHCVLAHLLFVVKRMQNSAIQLAAFPYFVSPLVSLMHLLTFYIY